MKENYRIKTDSWYSNFRTIFSVVSNLKVEFNYSFKYSSIQFFKVNWYSIIFILILSYVVHVHKDAFSLTLLSVHCVHIDALTVQ